MAYKDLQKIINVPTAKDFKVLKKFAKDNDLLHKTTFGCQDCKGQQKTA